MMEVSTGLDGGDRERIAALRARGRFFWLDASLSETSREELVDALGVPERALRGPSRVHADGESVDFVLRCYVAMERPAEKAGYRLTPIQVQVVVTGDYLLTRWMISRESRRQTASRRRSRTAGRSAARS